MSGPTPQENIFCAAISGLCANPQFAFHSSVQLAEMARAIVRAAYNDDPDSQCADFTGPPPQSESDNGIIESARAAIAKARGKE